MRKEFTLTEEQFKTLLEASQPVRYMIIGGVVPSSPQENANKAWANLGKELKFDYMTVMPSGSDPRKFTAEEL